MGLVTNIDIFLIFVLLAISLIGLVRGFLNELSSIINWFGSAYLTSVLKPIITRLLSDNSIPTRFVSVATSLSLFIILVIAISIVNKMVVKKVEYYIPQSINGGLGFLFGFFKGVLFISIFLSSLNVVSGKIKVDFLSNSLVNNIMTKNDGFLINLINNITESFASKNSKTSLERLEEDKETEEDRAVIEQAREISRNSGRIEDHIKRGTEGVGETKKIENAGDTDLDKLINIVN
ncbi:MAG: CvpA family protein [Rickettsiales bacterium]|jgi:uncharacterized membrane protein required for colicin V production|nr:CvpA family protein [Rickettsiales bacterium]